jgi:hypothetical protein
VGEREGGRIGRYGEEPERGSRDKTRSDGPIRLILKTGPIRAVPSNGTGEKGGAQARRRRGAGVRATGRMYFIGTCLTRVYLMSMHLIGMHSISVYIMGVHLEGVNVVRMYHRNFSYHTAFNWGLVGFLKDESDRTRKLIADLRMEFMSIAGRSSRKENEG